jgi:hypothetical protein
MNSSSQPIRQGFPLTGFPLTGFPLTGFPITGIPLPMGQACAGYLITALPQAG